MEIAFKPALALLALVLTFGAFLPYYRSILGGGTRPHLFSWIIWGTGTVIVFSAQLSDGAGLGAWPIGVSGCLTIGVAVLAATRGADRTIRPVDWVFLAAGLLAVPLWYLSQSALSAVIILTIIDLLGFGPTVRKAYADPYRESIVFFAVGALRNLAVCLALENYSWTTMLFPASIGIACVGLVGLLILRRRGVPVTDSKA